MIQRFKCFRDLIVDSPSSCCCLVWQRVDSGLEIVPRAASALSSHMGRIAFHSMLPCVTVSNGTSWTIPKSRRSGCAPAGGSGGRLQFCTVGLSEGVYKRAVVIGGTHDDAPLERVLMVSLEAMQADNNERERWFSDEESLPLSESTVDCSAAAPDYPTSTRLEAWLAAWLREDSPSAEGMTSANSEVLALSTACERLMQMQAGGSDSAVVAALDKPMYYEYRPLAPGMGGGRVLYVVVDVDAVAAAVPCAL